MERFHFSCIHWLGLEKIPMHPASKQRWSERQQGVFPSLLPHRQNDQDLRGEGSRPGLSSPMQLDLISGSGASVQ